MKKLLQFGAGNIGRSFTGQLFSAAGYVVVFADVDERLIAALNEKKAYTVAVRDKISTDIVVKNVRAIRSTDIEAVCREMADADICATAVGPAILPKLFPVMAQALTNRGKSIDIILCENLRDAAAITRNGVKGLLPVDFPLDKRLGLVETSIGKMVPVVPESVRKQDPLTVYAESYNTLILDKRGFLNGVPEVAGLSPKENMKAWVDRKSFIHNLGHAALAYFAFETAPQMVYTWEAVQDVGLRERTREVMRQAGAWLIKTYPSEFNTENINAHIEELLDRFGNQALGDTLQRVGRDLQRKLGPEDRVVGALKACHEAGLPYHKILTVLNAGLKFTPSDLDGHIYEKDLQLVMRLKAEGINALIGEITGLTGKLLTETLNVIQNRRA
ncbi:MAG: mannitol-1-phosphate 5-dehydrogenase [Fibrobacterota bacterium]